MDNNRWIDSWHVLMGPGEYVFVFFREVDEVVLEASRQLRSYLDHALCVLVSSLIGSSSSMGPPLFSFFFSRGSSYPNVWGMLFGMGVTSMSSK